MKYRDFERVLATSNMEIKDLPVSAKNENDEDTILDAPFCDEDGPVFSVTTVQTNGWLRINYYHKDGTVEEMYER